jgi:hypothetical protein
MSIVIDAITAINNEFTMPWAESFLALDHTHSVAIICFSTNEVTTFNRVGSWFKLALSGCTNKL